MPRAVDELRDIPFGYLVGAPLKAAVEAQALAARSTIDFIQKVGFKEADSDVGDFTTDLTQDANAGEIRNVTFTYSKTGADAQPTNVSLTVPFLSIVPIPFIRVDEMTIDFTAKLTDTIQSTTKQNFNFATDVKGKYKAFWSPVSLEMRTSMSYASSRESTSKFVREYQMTFHIRAVQDDLPAGLERMLDLLAQTIKEKPAVAGGGG